MTAVDAHLFYNGDIVTMDPAFPDVDAIAVRDGRIAAVGSLDRCRAAVGPGAEPHDLRGACLLPGFIDTHLHPIPLIYYRMNVDLCGVASIEELQRRLRAQAAGTAPDKWVVGVQFDENATPTLRIPTRHDLDVACPRHGVLVFKHDGHTVIANTRAIAAAGLSAATADPDGGTIDREPGGFPAGPFRETAAALPLAAMPVPDLDGFATGAASAFSELTRYGITSAGVILQAGAEGPAGAQGAFDIALLQALLEHVPIPLYSFVIAADPTAIAATRQTPLHDRSGRGHRVGGMKLYADGTFGSCTASMHAPFSDRPDTCGFMTIDPDELYRRMVAVHTAGMQLAIHAIGDAANERCVDLYARLLHDYPRRDHRHRLEHASLLTPATIDAIAALGIVVSTQPLFIHSEKAWLQRRLGKERASAVYPLRALTAAGVRVAGASDAPVESADVLHAIECCVTREGFETQQGISPLAALRMYTSDAAYAQFEETDKGTLSPGKRADMVVLGGNPLRVQPERIRCIAVEQTFVAGKRAFRRGGTL